ncbi:SDR family oxidoreductase [Pseudoruegeria sp. HB172150]|uniref:SDR family oxidoreductase n=1 Tax=Pseudoruegeria sp. HB172150 TaxID=2721164 RepID=UPI001557E987|nr:SDR family oxidoreductase [Pseudoruegeria sp. HB172150]
MTSPTMLVAGASGALGRLVANDLSSQTSKENFALMVRKPEDLTAYETQGFTVRTGDYEDAASLATAFSGIERLLLISTNALGKTRARQHGNVIDAAVAAGIGFIAYTSILKADSSPMKLAVMHRTTEEAISTSGIPHAFLRNGWYSENLLAALPQTLGMGQHFGSAGTGRFSTAPRRDYAKAAAKVLIGEGHEGKTYEFAGDTAFDLTEFAAMVSDASGTPVTYTDMPPDAYRNALVGAGLPTEMAAVLVDSDVGASHGWLEDHSGTLSRLIGHRTEPMLETIRANLLG